MSRHRQHPWCETVRSSLALCNIEWRRVEIPKRGSGGSVRRCDFSKVRSPETELFIFFCFSDRNNFSIVLHRIDFFYRHPQRNLAFEPRDAPIWS